LSALRFRRFTNDFHLASIGLNGRRFPSTAYLGQARRRAGGTAIKSNQPEACSTWIAASGKNLTTIYSQTPWPRAYISWGQHKPEEFPKARFMATRGSPSLAWQEQCLAPVVTDIGNQGFRTKSIQRSSSRMNSRGAVGLEGEQLVTFPLGQKHRYATRTCCKRPRSIAFVVAGDSGLSRCSSSFEIKRGNKEGLDRGTVHNRVSKTDCVVVRHNKAGAVDTPNIIEETQNNSRFRQDRGHTQTASEL